LIERYIADGKIVPVEITGKLLQDAIQKEIDSTGKLNFLVDGFPRSLENWNGYRKFFGITDDT
jgi:UMP-CMP kinase